MTLLLMLAVLAGYAGELNFVETEACDQVNSDACCLLFPARHDRFERLYRMIEQLRQDGEGRLNILHVGGSHVQAGVLSQRLRCNFTQIVPERPKSRGLMFPFRAIRSNAPTDYEFSGTGVWKRVRCLDQVPACTLGLSGAAAIAASDACSLSLSVDSTCSFVRLRVLGEPTGCEAFPLVVTAEADTLHPELTEGDYLFSFPQPANACTIIFEGVQEEAGFALRGVWPECEGVGVSYTESGINGAAVPSWLRCERFAEELKRLCPPDLVILGIGINDANVAAHKFNAETFKENYRQLIRSILDVNPDAALLFITNNDCWLRVGRRRHVLNANGSVVEQAMTELAGEFDGAVFDQYQVMGGLGSSNKWVRAGLMNRDHVHFRPAGYRMMADLIFNAFVQDYNDYIR